MPFLINIYITEMEIIMKKKTHFRSAGIILAAVFILSLIPATSAEAKTKMPFKGTKTLSSSNGLLGSGATIKLKSNGKFTMESGYADYDGVQNYYTDYSVGTFTNVKKSSKKYTMKYAPVKGYKSRTKNYTKDGVKYHDSYGNAYFKKGQKFTLYAPGYKVSSLPKRVRKVAKEIRSAVIISSENKTLKKTHGYILDSGKYEDVFCETVSPISSTSEGLITKPVNNVADGIYYTSIAACKVFKQSGTDFQVTLDTSLNQPYFEIVTSGSNTKKTKYSNIKFTMADDCKWSESGVLAGSLEACTKEGNYTASSYKQIKADIDSAREDLSWDAGLEFVVTGGKLVNIISVC